jgi:prepilin-type N-terminal cleavage/methylation domain-containing protein
MSPSSKRQSGFSLVEFLVVIAALGMILWIFGQLFFPMQKLATRQRLDVESRQTARAALDYLHFMLRGAGDMNSGAPGNRTPALFLTWACFGTGSGTAAQVTYNNVANANLADIGTDIITFARATSSAPVLLSPTASFTGDQSATASRFSYNEGCNADGTGSAANLALFKQATGTHDVGGVQQSEIMTVFNSITAAWGFYRITSYDDGNNADCCSLTKRWLSVIANPTTAQRVQPYYSTNPPGGAACNGFPLAQLNSPQLVPGLRFYSLRVRNGWLEQKTGVFNPNTDNPGTDFVQILPNVEDLQIAYLFSNNQIRNNLTSNRLPSGQQYVPGVSVGAGFDVLDVWAIRFTVTVRSTAEVPGGLNVNNIQPVAEDHDPKTDTPAKVKDNFYHVQLTGTAALRNRTLGS